LNILVCVKRVPATAGRITLTADSQEIDTRYLGFTISPHEECAVEEAVRLVEKHGGSTTVLTLGSEAASDQLRDAMALGAATAILLATDRDWDPMATAAAITDTIRAKETAGRHFDLLLFGNEAADSGDYQVPVRVAEALDYPCVTGVKGLEVREGTAVARREVEGGWETFEVSLPAVISVREGINLPRYPSLPGRLRAKKADLERLEPRRQSGGPTMLRLLVPPQLDHTVQILGTGVEAAPAAVALFQQLGIL
jgi:electron transfer flavoprotein beta subunit